jgi:cytochrome c biogenesis protein CcdA
MAKELQSNNERGVLIMLYYVIGSIVGLILAELIVSGFKNAKKVKEMERQETIKNAIVEAKKAENVETPPTEEPHN